MSHSDTSHNRYARQVILPGVGAEGQARLGNARVLIAGLGGLGCPASLYLAAAGVGTMGLADPDTVDESNLHRQILHAEDSIGMLKVDSAAQRLRKQNPHLAIERFPEGITPENAIQLFADFDIIIDGTDNFASRYLINDAAFFTGKPVVHGSIYQFEGQVSVFHPNQGSPCYRCLFPDIPDPAAVPNCAEAGVFGALCGIIGSWQASEAIKWITGLGEPAMGHIKVLDTLSSRDRLVSLDKNPDCPLCGSNPTIKAIEGDTYSITCSSPSGDIELPLEVTPSMAKGFLQGDQPPFLLDVREHRERAICLLDDDQHIPTGELQWTWQSLPRDRPILIYCHHGIRSLYAARFLRDQGYALAQSLQGGIDGWSREVDPSVPRY